MNSYWWKDENSHVGNVYALNEEEAKLKVGNYFDAINPKVELLKSNVSVNHLTQEKY